jgi:hypothetical protein
MAHAVPPAWSGGFLDDAREAASEVLEGLTKLLKRHL